MIAKIGILILSICLIPIIYIAGIVISKGSFALETNTGKKPLRSVTEIVLLVVSILLSIKLWYSFIISTNDKLSFAMFYLSLILVFIVSVTDIWENLVSNRVLLIFLCIFVLILGVFFFVSEASTIEYLKGSAIGIVFSVLCFGVVYLATKGGLGAGDVKLALVISFAIRDTYAIKVFFFGCVAAAIYSVTMLVRKKLSRHSTFPFVPFIFIGMGLAIILG